MKCPATGVPDHICTCARHDRRSIGGKLDYAALAVKHRPQYRDDVERAVRDMTARGLRPADIATALGITTAAVTALLESPHMQPDAARGDEAAAIHREAWSGQRGER